MAVWGLVRISVTLFRKPIAADSLKLARELKPALYRHCPLLCSNICGKVNGLQRQTSVFFWSYLLLL